MPIVENIGRCGNCGNGWGAHYGDYCQPEGSRGSITTWSPTAITVEPQLPTTESTTKSIVVRIKNSSQEYIIDKNDLLETLVHGFKCFVVERGTYDWAVFHFATGVYITSGHSTREMAIDRANDFLSGHDKGYLERMFNGCPIINSLHKKPVKTRPIKIGDWVQLTKSEEHWDDRMDQYDGLLVQVTEVIPGYHGNTLIRFENSGDWDWSQRDRHFKRVDPKIAKRPVVFSTSMLKWLKEIRHESNIARIILACRELEHDKGGWISNYVLTSEDVSYITYRSNGNISYLPKNKVCKMLPNGNWDPAGRQEGKPAKVMRKLFTAKALKMFKETDFEIFNNKFRSKFSTDGYEFKVFPASDIPKVYGMKCDTDTGAIYDSCMRGDGHLMDIYTHCKGLQIVTLLNKATGDIAGRALLWKATRDNGDEINFLDRFYCTKDHLYDAFVDYAKSNDLWYKREYRSFQDKMGLYNPETCQVETVAMSVRTRLNFDSWPYIDTFSYSTEEELRNHEEDTCYTYNCTNGCRTDDEGHEEGGDPNDGMVEDCITGLMIDEDEAVRIDRGEHRNGYTDAENVVNVDGYNYWAEDDDVCYSEYDERHYLMDDCIWSEHHNSYILTEDAYEIDRIGVFHKDIVNKL